MRDSIRESGDGSVAQIANLARAASDQKDWVQAERWWRECIETFGESANPSWYTGLANALKELDRTADANAILDEVHIRWPDLPFGWIVAAGNAIAQKHWLAAEQYWRICIERFGRQANISWYSGLVEALENLHRQTEADEIIKIELTRWPDSHIGLIDAAKSASAKRNWVVAEQWWRRSIDNFGDRASPQWYFCLHTCLSRLGKTSEARGVFRLVRSRWPVLRQWPDSRDGWTGAAEKCAAGERWGRAERLWRECLQRFPSEPPSSWYGGLARALRELERWSEADEIYEIIRSRWPKLPLGWTGAAQNAAAHKDWAGEERFLRECIQRFGESETTEFYSRLAMALRRQGRLEEARDARRIAQERFPHLASGWVVEARMAAARGRWRRSGQAWEAAAEREEGSGANDHLHQGFKSFLRCARFSDAARLLDQMTRRVPDDVRVLTAGFELLQAQGDSLGALDFLRENFNHPAFWKAFSVDQLAEAAFNIGLSPTDAIRCVSEWTPADQAEAAIDRTYALSRGSMEDASGALDQLKNRQPLSTYQQRRTVARAWLRNFLKNRTYRMFLSKFATIFSVATEEQVLSLRTVAHRYFPRSRLRHSLDQYLQSGGSDNETIAYASAWRTKLPQPGNSIAEKLKGLGKYRLACATVVRDEAEMMQRFVPYYKDLGVDCFIIVDNGSVDGLAGLREGVPGVDVIVIDAPYSFARNRNGVTWLNEIHESGVCDWLLYVDADEHLIFPGYEDRKLPELLDHLERRGETAMSGFMLDVYDKRYAQQLSASANIEDHTLFFAKYTVFKNFRAPFTEMVGGIRFFEHRVEVLAKTPLTCSKAGARYLDNHHLSVCTPAAVTCVLLHYKIFRDRDILGKTPDEIAAHSRYRDRGVRELVRILDLTTRAEDQRPPGPFHVELKGTSQLLGLGYMHTDDEWWCGLTAEAPSVHSDQFFAQIDTLLPATLYRQIRHVFDEQPDLDRLLNVLEILGSFGMRAAMRIFLKETFKRIESRPAKLAILLFAANYSAPKKVENRIALNLLREIRQHKADIVLADFAPILEKMASQNRVIVLEIFAKLNAAGITSPALATARSGLLVSLDRWPEAYGSLPKENTNSDSGARNLRLLILRRVRRWRDFRDTIANIIEDRASLDDRLLREIHKIPNVAVKEELFEALRRRLEANIGNLNAKEASIYLPVLYNLGMMEPVVDLYPKFADKLSKMGKLYFDRVVQGHGRSSAPRLKTIWCLGLSKTGTTSLHLYAQRLGLLTSHFFNAVTGELLEGNDLDLMDLVSDTPVVYHAMKYGVEPDRRLIVTTRDYDTWEKSFISHFQSEFAVKCEAFEELRDVFHSGLRFSFGKMWIDIHEELYFRFRTLKESYDYYCNWIDNLERRPGASVLRLPLEAADKSELVSRYLGADFPVYEYPSANRRASIN